MSHPCDTHVTHVQPRTERRPHVTDLRQLTRDYNDFLAQALTLLGSEPQLPEEGAAVVLNETTIATMLYSAGLDLGSDHVHTELARRTGLHPAALCRVIMGRVRMTTNVAGRFQIATGIPMQKWLDVPATPRVSDEPCAG